LVLAKLQEDEMFGRQQELEELEKLGDLDGHETEDEGKEGKAKDAVEGTAKEGKVAEAAGKTAEAAPAAAADETKVDADSSTATPGSSKSSKRNSRKRRQSKHDSTAKTSPVSLSGQVGGVINDALNETANDSKPTEIDGELADNTKAEPKAATSDSELIYGGEGTEKVSKEKEGGIHSELSPEKSTADDSPAIGPADEPADRQLGRNTCSPIVLAETIDTLVRERKYIGI
jgi:hypothetical protein